MKTYTFEGKNKEEAKNKALSELNTTEDNLIIKILEESIKVNSWFMLLKFKQLKTKHLTLLERIALLYLKNYCR